MILAQMCIICAISTFLQKGTNRAQGVFIEMFITAALVMTVLMLAAEVHEARPFAPVSCHLTKGRIRD